MSTHTSLLFHIVFSTKDREPCLYENISGELYAYLGGILNNLNGKALATGGWFDHVHILASLLADVALATVMRELKANSSSWIKRRFPELRNFAWQNGYGAFTVNESIRIAVTEYIRKQREHHRVKSFQDEYMEFLSKHKVDFDAKYIWK
jgi:REP element-mobilizing transposase RayT